MYPSNVCSRKYPDLMKPGFAKKKRILLFILPLLFGISACQNSPAAITAGPNNNAPLLSQMVEAQQTEAINTPMPSPSPNHPDNLVNSPNTHTPTLTRTPRATGTATTPTPKEQCEKAAPGFPGIDVTIDDDTVMQPGQRFTKIWRLTNIGSCTWTRDYQAIWFFGTRFGDTLAVNLGETVPPGSSIDIVVDMVAPQTAGTYRSNWKLKNTDGAVFGIGPAGSSPFWVQIVVLEPPTATPTSTSTPLPTDTPTPPPPDTATPTPTPVVFTTGSVILVSGDTLDIDQVKVNPQEGADLLYRPDEFSNFWLVPQSGVLLGVYGMHEPGINVCLTASMSMSPVPVNSISPGAYLCFITGQGRPGWLRLNQVDPAVFDIDIDLVIWAIQQ
jgi:hypothetical protein